MMNGWYSGGPGFGMLLGPLFLILIVAAVVWVIVKVMRPEGMAPPSASGTQAALDILKERFARGEIDKAEYEEKRRILTGN